MPPGSTTPTSPTRAASTSPTDFREAPAGQGMDVVLDCLAGEFVDAGLGLLPRGGRFLEMGKTDIRDPEAVAAAHPEVTYQAYDLQEAAPDRMREMLRAILDLLRRGRAHPAAAHRLGHPPGPRRLPRAQPGRNWSARPSSPSRAGPIPRARSLVTGGDRPPRRPRRPAPGRPRTASGTCCCSAAVAPTPRGRPTWRPTSRGGRRRRHHRSPATLADRDALRTALAATSRRPAAHGGRAHRRSPRRRHRRRASPPSGSTVSSAPRPTPPRTSTRSPANSATTWPCSCCSPRPPASPATAGQANYAAANVCLDALAGTAQGPGTRAASPSPGGPGSRPATV